MALEATTPLCYWESISLKMSYQDQDPSKRVVITGVGAVTPIGTDAKTTYENAIGGVSGIRDISEEVPNLGGVRIGGNVRGFDPSRYLLGKQLRSTPRFAQYSLVSSIEAGLDADALELNGETKLGDSIVSRYKLKEEFDTDLVGVEIGTAVGGSPYFAEVDRRILGVAKDPIYTRSVDLENANRASDIVHSVIGVRGAGSTPAAACSTANVALEIAAKRIKLGEQQAMFAGATDSNMHATLIRSFEAMMALSPDNNEPTRASRPFDETSNGIVLGEGAAVVFMESLESASNRGAYIYAELAGYWNNSYPDNGPRPDKEGEVKAMRRALEMAEITPDQVDLISTHGGSAPAGDPIEIASIKEVFGVREDLLITASKSLVGHTLGPAGGISTILTLMAMRYGEVHPVLNLNNPRDPELTFVTPTSRKATIDYAMINAFGLGGKNAILVFKRWGAD